MEETKNDFLTTSLETIRYLNSAECTSRFQSYFGVEPKFAEDNLDENIPNRGIEDDEDPKLRKRYEKVDENAADQSINGKVPTSPHPLNATPTNLYRINNRFAYYIFKFGSLLGQEEFYISFFPFWFWNFDGPTGRKIIILWALSMYIGQFIKEYMRWPRPASPPVVYLEKLFLAEYGMPSTHAIVSACVPFAVVYFECELCNLPVTGSCIFVAAYIILVCSSRLYVGVHTFAQVLAGLIISFAVILAYIPFAEDLDHWMMSSLIGPAAVIWICLGACLVYPSEGRLWTQPWGDTVAIVAVCAGVISGSWLGFRSGVWTWHRACLLQVPDGREFVRYVLRTALGLGVVLCTRFTVKPAYYTFASTLHHVKLDELKEKCWTCVELPAKFLTYFAIAFNVCFLMPTLFLWLGLNRY